MAPWSDRRNEKPRDSFTGSSNKPSNNSSTFSTSSASTGGTKNGSLSGAHKVEIPILKIPPDAKKIPESKPGTTRPLKKGGFGLFDDSRGVLNLKPNMSQSTSLNTRYGVHWKEYGPPVSDRRPKKQVPRISGNRSGASPMNTWI